MTEEIKLCEDCEGILHMERETMHIKIIDEFSRLITIGLSKREGYSKGITDEEKSIIDKIAEELKR